MKTVAIVQARMGSSRLPGKVMKPIVGVPMIELLLKRLARSVELDQIVVATSVDSRNIPLVEYVRKLGFSCEQGSELDVLERYLEAARSHEADVIVRITGDCPLVDAALVDDMIRAYRNAGVDYLANSLPPTYPDGLDIEVFSRDALEHASSMTSAAFDHEHVTPYLRESGRFKVGSFENEEDLSSWRWTVDESTDLEVVRRIFENFSPDHYFNWKEVADLQRAKPEIFLENQEIKRNEGAAMSSGQKLWKRAKQVIPGGNMLLSKRAEMFLPEQWPAYFSRTQGCTVWDLDGRELIDMSLMGVGTNTLGYCHPEVNTAVHAVVDAGNLSTLNCPEEVWLAEKLIEINPFADMARFTRSGGEANAVAVRIARAASGRDGVAVCGYHGWHDWYLSANLGENDSLAGHLLPGLDPAGVPKALRGVVHPFNYNDLEALEALIARGDIGVIKMEVVRNAEPTDGFLKQVRDLASKNGIVLIFDECTSGFRETYGGLYLKYGVEPDMAVYGKTLGNGYAINAVVGRRSVMEAAQTTFISSTFWSERTGPAAALKTLEVMAREKSWQKITEIGQRVRSCWQELADHHGLTIHHAGLSALATFSFDGKNALAYKSLMTQEMLAQGFLASTGTYACLAHTPEILTRYTEALDPVFGLIAQCEDGLDVHTLLQGPVCHSSFRRIN